MSNTERSLMRLEAAASPAMLRQQPVNLQARLPVVAERWRAARPRMLITCGRGSSDHAGVFIRYMFETELGIPSSSASPSTLSLYGSSTQLDNCAVLLISQSGQSPDLVEYARAARLSGALTIGLINQSSNTPLGEHCDFILPLCAGPERSVAATKSWLASLYAAVQLLALCSESATLTDELPKLPDHLQAAQALDWTAACTLLQPANNMLVLGRGPGLGVANEIALKFKETCRLHAESFSAAEVLHGPLAMVGPELPVLVFDQGFEARDSINETIERLLAAGAPVLHAAVDPAPGCIPLPTLSGLSPWCTLMSQAQSAYLMIEELSRLRGHNPDCPSHIAKITKTL